MRIEITTRGSLPGSLELPQWDDATLWMDSQENRQRLERTKVWARGQEYEFAELFACRWHSSESRELIWRGDTGRLHALARGWTVGRVLVEGDVGDHAGHGMRSGRLEIRGGAGDWLAADLHGGMVHVTGAAGHNVAAALPGQRRGMTGGTVVVGGAVATGLGRRMRRGIVVVHGDAVQPGVEMLAGTIIVGGSMVGPVGALMKRGTLICLHALTPAQRRGLAAGIIDQPLVWRMLRRHLSDQGIELADPCGGQFQRDHAGPWHGWRGEVWSAVS